MTKEELIIQARRISNRIEDDMHGSKAEAKEFLRTYAGPNNSFLEAINELTVNADFEFAINKIVSILDSFISYVENGLLRSISLEREIQIDTVSDYLDQADALLHDKKVHPAAPAVIIGASLEEFLRTWLEDEGVDLTTIDMNINSYAQELKNKGFINKQDVKDITSWSGTRNDAAHGHWENVQDRSRIKLMLEGVNLFMRQHSKSK